jgi:hypothetical protein
VSPTPSESTASRGQEQPFVLATGYTAAQASTRAPVVTGSVQRTIREGSMGVTEEPARRAVVAVASPGASQLSQGAATPLVQRASTEDGDPVQRASAEHGTPIQRTSAGDGATIQRTFAEGSDEMQRTPSAAGSEVTAGMIQRAAEPFPVHPPRGDEQAMPLASADGVPGSAPAYRSDAPASQAGVVSAAAFQAGRASGRGRGLPLVQRASAGRGVQAERGPALTYAARGTAEARAAFSTAASALATGAAFSGAASALAASAPAMIQRCGPVAEAGGGSGSGVSIPAGPAPEVPAVPLPEPREDGVDVSLIARQVYEILVRRLVSERRQRGW